MERSRSHGRGQDHTTQADRLTWALKIDDAESYFRHSRRLALAGLSKHRAGDNDPLGRFETHRISSLRMAVAYVGQAIMYLNGPRIEDTSEILLSGVDLDSGRIRYFGKGHKDSILYPEVRLTRVLRWYLDEVRPLLDPAGTSEYLLIDPDARSRRGRMPSDTLRIILKWAWDSWCDDQRGQGRTVFPPFTPHVIRHTFGTALRKLGTDLRVIKDVMHHEKIETTAKYDHPDEDDIRAAVRRLDELADDDEPIELGRPDHPPDD